jgi:hypothetical protein
MLNPFWGGGVEGEEGKRIKEGRKEGNEIEEHGRRNG